MNTRDNAAGTESDNSSPPSVEVMNAWSYISTLPYALIAYTGNAFLPYLYTQ